MKYFTLDWWRGYAECDFEEYNSSIDNIRPLFTDNIANFVDDISLHDAQIIHFHLDVKSRKLEFLFNALFASDGPATHEYHNLKLVYEDVSDFHSTATPDKALRGPASYGELGYDEVEFLENQIFEHRILFSSGIEMQIQFKNISWQRLD